MYPQQQAKSLGKFSKARKCQKKTSKIGAILSLSRPNSWDQCYNERQACGFVCAQLPTNRITKLMNPPCNVKEFVISS